MSKGKLEKFAEVEGFSHVVQPKFEEVFKKDYKLKGKWSQEFFGNSNPITLELACGKGEYTVGMAEMFPNRNFIGMDIKGARIWKGAKRSRIEEMANVGFIRTRIEMIESFFEKDEVEEIWITFPDPQLKKPRKRLTSSRFLKAYKNLLKEGGTINLKTDNPVLYQFTKDIAELNKLNIEIDTDDVYNSPYNSPILSIKTFYEKGWLEQGLRSHYIRFKLSNDGPFQDPPERE